MLKIEYPSHTFILILLLSIFYTTNSFSQNKAITTAGDVILFVLPAATLATTFIAKDKEGSWQFTKTFLINQALTFGLKYTVNKERPDNSDNLSFPSGHTSTTFQSASFIHRRYGFKKSIPAYLLAGFTCFFSAPFLRANSFAIAVITKRLTVQFHLGSPSWLCFS